MDMNGIWAMYRGMKQDRLQRERYDVADDQYADRLRQQSLANANTERAFNYGVNRDTDQDQLAADAVDAAAKQQTLTNELNQDTFDANEAWRVTSEFSLDVTRHASSAMNLSAAIWSCSMSRCLL